jgi:hypothetical protein
MSERICGPTLTNISTATLFTGVDEIGRMKDLRTNITKVRKIWQSNSEYSELMSKIKSYPLMKTLSPNLQSKIGVLLNGYSDWADMNYGRPLPLQRGFPAIELYCSQDGYQFFFSLFNSIFRQKEIDDDLLLIATALVEFVTIELYNLRLANIGNPYYENFQAVTYRGMTVSSNMANEYKKAANNPDLSKRHFGVPLGFTSSSTARETMEEFAFMNEGEEQMHWVIHVHGIDPELLRIYHEKYDDSIVTSITAMPVGQIAELRGEREVLLRGAFFHIVNMESRESEGKMIHTLQLVAMNTNRDHGTELALDEGAKQEQRNFFRNMILASRFRLCASLARSYSQEEAHQYDELAKASLQMIDDSKPEISAGLQSGSMASHTDRILTWYGDVTGNSFPANYYNSRMEFHSASSRGHWSRVRKLIEKEYDWEIADWLNSISLSDPSTGRTLLHEMAWYGPPSKSNNVEYESWVFLVQMLDCHEVWSRTTAPHAAIVL